MTFETEIIQADLEQTGTPRGHYLRSNGDLAVIAEMPVYHLKAAFAKTLRDEPNRVQELADLSAEIAKRDADYAAKQAEESNDV